MRYPLAVVFVLVASALVSTQAPPEDKFFDSRGVRIHYIEAGRGVPIVLVHGFSRDIQSNWVDTGVFAKLAAGHHVVALDLRGHGKSDKPHDWNAYREDLHLDVLRLMDHLKIQRAHIVGYSMGSSIAGRLIVTNPERFITATLGAGTPPRGVWEPIDDEDAKKSAADVKAEVPFRSLVVLLTPLDEPKRTEEQIREFSALLTKGNDLDALAAVRLAYGRGQLSSEEEVKAIKVPVLAIVGDQDPLVRGVRNFSKLLPAMKLVEIPGATHASERSAARRPEFVEAVIQFVDTHK